MDSHVIDYKIHGDDMQVVAIELDPNEVNALPTRK